VNFLCGTRTFWLFGVLKVTECSQVDFISRGNGGLSPSKSGKRRLVRPQPEGSSAAAFFDAAFTPGGPKTGVGQFASAPYTRTSPDSWSVNCEVGMQLEAREWSDEFANEHGDRG
jgi:hypothetical protein